jgi:hypothetical protein
MSDNENTQENQETQEATITIKVSNQNLQYKSDFSEPETIFWLESVKSLIMKKAFEMAGLTESTK